MEILTETWNKLVRDKVPDWIRFHGGVVKTRVLEDDTEYEKYLWSKLAEEVGEANRADDEHLLEEFGDVEIAIDDILKHRGLTRDQLREQQIKKDQDRGTFSQRVFLISTEGEAYGKTD